MFKCSPTAEDSLEHYCRCCFTRELASRYLRLPEELHCNLYTFTLCNPHTRSMEDLIVGALLVYSIYRATNHIRHNGLIPPAEVYGALTQWSREGARGHRRATKALDSRWRADEPSTPLPPIPMTLPPRKHARALSRSSGHHDARQGHQLRSPRPPFPPPAYAMPPRTLPGNTWLRGNDLSVAEWQPMTVPVPGLSQQ